MRRKWLLSSTAFAAVQVLATQNAVEVFGEGDPEIRVTQTAVEVFGTSDPDIRTTQNAVEVLGTSNPDIRITQTAVEVFGSAIPSIRATQIAVEVLAPVSEPPPPEPGFGYGHNFAFHAFHDTGPTSNSIPHDMPLNQWTTTKGIGLRRKVFAAFEPPPLPPAFTIITIRTCACPQQFPPIPPEEFAAIPGGDENIELTWTPNPFALCYNIYRGTTSGGETLLVSCVNTPYVDAPIVCGETYYYYITAVSNIGEGPPSPEIVVTTDAIPGAPANFTATQLDQINTELTWDAEPDADYYSIYRGESPGGETILATPVTGTSYNDGSRLCGNTYYYYIVAHGCGVSDPSPEIEHSPCCDWSDCCGCVPAVLDVEVNELYGCPVTGTATFDSGDQEYNFSQSNCQGAVSFIAYCTGGNWFVDVIQSGEGGPCATNTYPLTGTCSPFNMSAASAAFICPTYGNSTIQINLTEP